MRDSRCWSHVFVHKSRRCSSDGMVCLQDKSRSAMRSLLLSNSGYLFSLMQNSSKTVVPSWVRLDPVRTLSNPDKASVTLASLPRSLPHSHSILPLRGVPHTQ